MRSVSACACAWTASKRAITSDCCTSCCSSACRPSVDALIGVPRRREDDVLAGLQTVDAVHAAVVGLPAAGLLQRALAALHDVAKRADGRAGNGLGVLVEDGAGDDATARDLQLHLKTLAVGELDRRAGPARLALAVGAADVTGLRRREVEPALGKRAEGEAARVVRRRAAAAADLVAARQAHARPARRLAGPGDHDRRRKCCPSRRPPAPRGRSGRVAAGPAAGAPRAARRAAPAAASSHAAPVVAPTSPASHSDDSRDPERALISHSCPVRRPARGVRLVDAGGTVRPGLGVTTSGRKGVYRRSQVQLGAVCDPELRRIETPAAREPETSRLPRLPPGSAVNPQNRVASLRQAQGQRLHDLAVRS